MFRRTLTLSLVLAAIVVAPLAASPGNVAVTLNKCRCLNTSTITFNESLLAFADANIVCTPDGGGYPAGFTITTLGHTYRAYLTQLCSDDPPSRSFISAPVSWALEPLLGENPASKLATSAKQGGWVFDPGGIGTKNGTTQRFAWSFHENGAVIGSGRFAVAWQHGGGSQRIWQGTDAFVNVCVNKLHQLRSQGGRLYCYAGQSWFASSIRVLR